MPSDMARGCAWVRVLTSLAKSFSQKQAYRSGNVKANGCNANQLLVSFEERTRVVAAALDCHLYSRDIGASGLVQSSIMQFLALNGTSNVM